MMAVFHRKTVAEVTGAEQGTLPLWGVPLQCSVWQCAQHGCVSANCSGSPAPAVHAHGAAAMLSLPSLGYLQLLLCPYSRQVAQQHDQPCSVPRSAQLHLVFTAMKIAPHSTAFPLPQGCVSLSA